MSRLFESPADLGGYLFRITDNGGKTFDRLTVVFCDGSYLGLSSSPSHPLGFSQWGEGLDVAGLSENVEAGTEVDLALGDLPPAMVDHILFRNNQGFQDFLDALEKGDPAKVAPNREEAQVNDGTSQSTGVGIYRSGKSYLVKLDSLEDDRGPFDTAREALLATLPDACGLCGPEYHPPIDVTSLDPTPGVKEKIAALEAQAAEPEVEAESGPRP